MRTSHLVSAALFFALAAGTTSAQDVDIEARSRPVLQGVDLFGRDEDYRISILVEVGVVMPPITLLQLPAPGDVLLEIRGGPAEFLHVTEDGGPIQRLKRVGYRARTIVLPEILLGEEGLPESNLIIQVDGTPVAEPIRLAVLDKGVIEDFWLSMVALKPAILAIDPKARFVVADLARTPFEGLLEDEKMLEDLEEYQRKRSREPDQLYNPDGEEEVRCPELVWYRPKLTDSFPVNSCALNLRPSGRAEFPEVADPQAAGFSVKLESVDDGSLVWAQVPATDGIDGLYRTSWGCGIALKVPNNVIAIVYKADASCCRGPLALLAGARCSWFDTDAPGNENWANCPL